jgi:CheY-like chemotaxis protein
MLQILIAYMRKNKLQYTYAMDGLQALHAYKSAPLQYRTIFMGKLATLNLPHLCICSLTPLDISMPVMGGLESTRAIRAFEKEQQIPAAIIIVLTGMASASIEQEAVGSGASLFLTKPLRFKELGSILEQFKTR